MNLLSAIAFDLTELRTERQIITTTVNWKKQLDDFLTSYDILNDADTIFAKQAQEKAYAEYNRFRLIQDNEYLLDFENKLKLGI